MGMVLVSIQTMLEVFEFQSILLGNSLRSYAAPDFFGLVLILANRKLVAIFICLKVVDGA